ncbi:MAG: hypothetical protein IPL52_07635 [Flavobacteriales bacterium]|nr:hypothetical protein [Flavobacteriales bacterium]
MRCATLFIAICGMTASHAQPLIDLLSVNAMGSPGLNRSELSATLPLRLDTLGRLLVLDPYWVQWQTITAGDRYVPQRTEEVQETMQGAGGAITYVAPLGHGWKLAVAGIVRYHWLGDQRRGDIQPGGVLLASRAYKSSLTARCGVYVNHDAFGLFVMPLLGIDWRISPNTNLYGVLPGSMTFERKSRHWYRWGLSFRAYTTSFGVRDGDYRRINENPLGLYVDHYISRHIVLRTEAGWCIMRNVFGGPGDPLRSNTSVQRRDCADHGIPDGPYARLLLAYRLRLD